MPQIELDHITLDYRLYGLREKSLRGLATQSLIGGQMTGQGRFTRALDDISLSLKAGDRLAIVGSNGAGKSSLLKLLAGVFEPTQGTVALDGEVGTLFDIYHGMADDLTGIQFIFNRGLFRGASKKELSMAIPEIREFSGLGEYLEQPLRIYSDGMRVRLAFAIAIQFEPDILLLDEIFGAGDQAFFEKATTAMLDIAERTGITVFSTHWLELAERFCNRAIWLDRGRIVAEGDLDTVFSAYSKVRTQY